MPWLSEPETLEFVRPGNRKVRIRRTAATSKAEPNALREVVVSILSESIFTSGDIARLLGRRSAQVRHILNTRTHISAIGRAGTAWLYDERAVDLIRRELEDMDARKALKPIAT